MTESQRRTFLKTAGMSAVALTMSSQNGRASQKSDLLKVAVIGTGGMGSFHVGVLAGRKDVELAYVCDVDTTRLAKAAKRVESAKGKAPVAVKDMREILDDQTVDAVFIATPDHWHAPAAILALDAGKHVYVEKPCCHNIREGQLLVEAVRRTGKLLQVGTQSRSTDCVKEAIQRVKEGEIGEVLVTKTWNTQKRRSIGKTQPSQPPKHLDFDLWVGPAPMVEYRSNLLHGIWRWWYDFGCGDIGNDGVHDIDVGLWGFGAQTHPTRATCFGGKLYFDDDQQFPDTQYAMFEYPTDSKPEGRKKQFIFEQRIWTPYNQDGYDNGAAFYGTGGVMIVGHAVGWRLYGPRNKLIAERSDPVSLPAHHTNFFDCIRGTQKQLNANVHMGHRAATLVHLANIGARVGGVLEFDPQSEKITSSVDAAILARREYREKHWATPIG